MPPAREVPPPSDTQLRREIDSLAALVARSGAAVEHLARRQAAAGEAAAAAASKCGGACYRTKKCNAACCPSLILKDLHTHEVKGKLS